MTDAEIDAVARAIYERRNGHGCRPWARLPRAHRDEYRADAKMAIAVIEEWMAPFAGEGRGIEPRS